MNFGSIVFFYVFVTGLLMAQYTITGFDASAHMSEETRQASLRRGLGHGHVGRRLGDLRLHPADRRDVRAARTRPTTSSSAAGQGILTFAWTSAMSEGWAEFLLFIAVVAQTLLHDRVGHLGLADDVRVLTRPRCSGPSVLAAGLEAGRVPVNSRLAICVLSFLLMIPTL